MSNLPMADLPALQEWAASLMASRAPDLTIGGEDNPYMRRWFVIPRNPFQNIYLHEILRSDDDRAGHDHPWDNQTLVIDGQYSEVLFHAEFPWQSTGSIVRKPGDTVIRKATDTHRLVVPEGGRAVTLFTTGPRVRDWGFWCPRSDERKPRWIHWRDFTSGPNGETVGLGCEQ